jgi:Cdc6-like AAA superfamily ATPase
MPIKSSQTGSEIAARKKEKAQLLGLLKNSINVFVFGPHGIGKTILIKTVAEEYANRFGQAVYIDCLLYQTANAILREILFSLGSVIASKSNYDLAKRLREKTRKVNLVAILDHAENLKDYEILKFLFGLNIPVCLVSNNFVCYKRLSSPMKSRIPNIVKLQNPSKEEVLNIIRERAGSIEKRLLDEIAEKVEGNITLAVNLLESIKVRNAGRCLIQDFFSHENKIKKQLNEDCKTILKILKQKKKLPGGELFRLYQRNSEFPKSERSFRKYMQALCKRGIVKSIGDKRGRLYELIGGAI